jgi:hypothetical protein
MHPPTLARPLWSVRGLFVAGVLLFFTLLSVQYSFKVLDHQRDNRSAILRWRDQILDLNHGINIFDRYSYPNPPIMVLLLLPVVQLPSLAASLAWFYLKAGMAVAAIALTFRLVESRDRPFPVWGKALAVLLSLRPIMGDLSHGNINLFILLLVVASLYALSHRRQGLAGLLLALGIACKVTPALFVPYFLWKRAWKALAACAVGLVLFFWLVPGLYFGMGRNAEYLQSWVERMILPYALGGEVTTEHNNQSLPGVVHRLLTPAASFSTFDGPQYVPLEQHNFLSLDRRTAGWVVKGCMGLFVLLVVWTCRTPVGVRGWGLGVRKATISGLSLTPNPQPQTPLVGQRWRLAAEFSMVVLGMLLFSERTWKHHCVTLLIPFSVIAYYLSAERPGPRLRGYLIGTLVAVVLLMLATSTGYGERLDRAAKLAQTYGAYVWAYLLLLAALVVMLRVGAGCEGSGEHVCHHVAAGDQGQ